MEKWKCRLSNGAVAILDAGEQTLKKNLESESEWIYSDGSIIRKDAILYLRKENE